MKTMIKTMRIKNKRQIFIALIAVLISVTLVAVAVYAATTVGNDVAVGGSLTVLDEAAFNGADISGSVGVSSQGGYGVFSMALGKATTSVTTTCAVFAQVPIGVSLGEPQDYYNACLAGYDGSVNYGLSIEASSSETVIDILLQNGGTISNATDGIIALSGTTALATTTIGGGTAIVKHLSTSTSIDVPSVPVSSCLTPTSTSLVGVAAGDTVIASPTPVADGIEHKTLSWSAFASTTDEVALRICNVSTSTAADPDPQTWRFDVWKH